MKKMILMALALASLSGCASTKPYNNRYGGFDNKADADCAFLVFQRDAKKQLGNKWDAVYQECRKMSDNGTPLTQATYNEIIRDPHTLSSAATIRNGLGNSLLTISKIIMAQQLISQQLDGNSHQASQCGSISIAPLAPPGCKNVCINGRWAEMC